MGRRGPTSDEARRGIFLDFEGRTDEAPAVLGTLWVSRQGQEPMFRQYVLDPTLRPLVAPPVGSASLAGELRSLLGRAERQHRVLIGWSGHELEVVREHCPDLAAAFEDVYRDAKVPAKTWARLTGLKTQKDGRKRRHRLASYEAVAGIDRPEDLGSKEMSKAIRDARRALNGGTGALSEKQAARWQRMLEHNELDCRGAREVTMRALEDLAEADRASSERPAKREGKKKAKRTNEAKRTEG